MHSQKTAMKNAGEYGGFPEDVVDFAFEI